MSTTTEPKKKTKIIKPYRERYQRDNGTWGVKTFTGNQSNVQTNLQSQTEIKNILKKYQHTGQLPINQNKALYDDFSEVVSYQEAQNLIINAEEQFSNLTAPVRKRFGNDPENFLQFCNDPDNADELIKLGLAPEKIQEPSHPPIKVIVTNPETDAE